MIDELLTCNLISILVAHEVQQIFKDIQSVPFVALLIIVQTSVNGVRECVDTFEQRVALSAVLVEHRVQISGGFGFLHLFLELVDIDQPLNTVEQILGTLFGLLVRFLRSAGLDAFVLDSTFDFIQGWHGEVL